MLLLFVWALEYMFSLQSTLNMQSYRGDHFVHMTMHDLSDASLVNVVLPLVTVDA